MHDPYERMVTVEKAIRRGQLMVNVPVLFIMPGVIGILLFVVLKELAPVYFAALGIILAPLAGWIYWSFAITRWRIWAFSKVDDVHELKREAVAGKLIWPDGSFFEKTEIRTKTQDALIKALEKRFNEPGKPKVFVDDPAVPPVTKVYYSKSGLSVTMAALVFGLSLGIFALVKTDAWIIGLPLVLLCGYGAIDTFKQLVAVDPLIILDENGLQVEDVKYPWIDINDFAAEAYSSQIVIETTEGMIVHTVDKYDLSKAEIIGRMKIYKGRFEMKAGDTLKNLRAARADGNNFA
jgi:hypothetical protein